MIPPHQACRAVRREIDSIEMAGKPVVTLASVQEIAPSELEALETSVTGHDDFTLSDWREELPQRHIFVAFCDNRFVGICGWSAPAHEARPYLWVHPDERRKGHVGAVVEALAVMMEKLGVSNVGKVPILAVGDEVYSATRLGAHLRAAVRSS